MERWGISSNGLYKKASVHCEEGPWWLFFLEWLNFTVCYWIPGIPFPRWKITRDSFLGSDLLDEGEETTLRDWYGDFNGFWHSKVCDPVYQKLWRKYKITNLELDYDEALEKFPDRMRWPWDEDDDEEGDSDDI